MREQGLLPFGGNGRPKLTIAGFAPYYSTALGDANLADALDVLKAIPDGSINAVVTSPPYALHFTKEYGNTEKQGYVEWFLPFAAEVRRVLSDDGSLVLNIGGSYNKGLPTRSLYHFHLLIALVERTGFHLAQECFWFNPAKMPMPAEWVTVRRFRVKDAVEYVWWLAKTPWPKADNRAVLRPYSKDMERQNQRGVQRTTRPSGHNIKPSFSKLEPGGSIPPNIGEEELATDLLKFGNNAANDLYTERCKEAGVKIHPARFPAALPEFFVKLLRKRAISCWTPLRGPTPPGLLRRACSADGLPLKRSRLTWEPASSGLGNQEVQGRGLADRRKLGTADRLTGSGAGEAALLRRLRAPGGRGHAWPEPCGCRSAVAGPHLAVPGEERR
jgi:DNA modification methylase